MGFFSALAFLGRLATPSCSASGFSSGLLWFAPAGAFLGLLCSLVSFLPLIFWQADSGLNIFILSLFCSLLWLSMEIWLSRAVHWDGLADLGDALGSGKQGSSFISVLKDSRLGVFGAIFLFLALVWQWLFLICLYNKALSEGISSLIFYLPVLACAWSRISPLWLAFRSHASHKSFLGKTLCQAMSRRIFYISLLQGLICLFLAFLCGVAISAILLLVVILILLIWRLSGIASNNGGLTGDYFGALVELSQLSFLACSFLGTI